MRLSRLGLNALTAALVLLCMPAMAVQQYAMTDLGTLGGTQSRAYGVNNLGQVVGYSSTGSQYHAFLYKPGLGMVDLFPNSTTSYAYGINNFGQIVGYAVTGGNSRAYIYSAATGQVTWLSTLGGYVNYAYAINDSGQVTGYSACNTGYPTTYAAFLYTPGSGMTNLGSLNAPSGYEASGRAVNSLGHVAGYSHRTGGGPHAFLYKPVTGMVDLGVRAPSDYASLAWGINDSGQVVGGSGGWGFIWQQGMGMSTPFGINSEAFAINNAGQVVGWKSGLSGPSHAFVWTASSGASDLGTLGGTYSAAYAISSNGYIAGYSSLSDGSKHATLWNPVPEPGNILILTSGLSGILILRRRRRDNPKSVIPNP